MAKILGEPFESFVNIQVDIRQKSLGRKQKTTDDLKVFNANTPWIRLSSSVEIEEGRAKKLASSLGVSLGSVVGRNLAKKLVLFAGVADGANADGSQKGGITQGGFDGSYGFLTGTAQGYKPMPGITSISTSYKNNGSLKQAQIQLKCFSRTQFEAIETIYLRLGYTMTLEWGHSLYYNNGGKIQNMTSLQVPNILFTESVINPREEGKAAAAKAGTDSNRRDAAYYDAERKARANLAKRGKMPVRIREVIQQNREKTGGNYDAMLAKVSNFSWTLNSDLSYTVVLSLISVGDIIDSLKMNLGGNSQSTRTVAINIGTENENFINTRLSRTQSLLHEFFYDLTERVVAPSGKAQLNAAANNALAAVDAAEAVDDFVPIITQKIGKEAIDAILAKWITPFEDLKEFLLGKKTKPLFPANVGPADTFRQPGSGNLKRNDTEWAFADGGIDGDTQKEYDRLRALLPKTSPLYKEMYYTPSTLTRNLKAELMSLDLDVKPDFDPTTLKPIITEEDVLYVSKRTYADRKVSGTIIPTTWDRLRMEDFLAVKTMLETLRTDFSPGGKLVTITILPATTTTPAIDNTSEIKYFRDQAVSKYSRHSQNIIVRLISEGRSDLSSNFQHPEYEVDNAQDYILF